MKKDPIKNIKYPKKSVATCDFQLFFTLLTQYRNQLNPLGLTDLFSILSFHFQLDLGCSTSTKRAPKGIRHESITFSE